MKIPDFKGPGPISNKLSENSNVKKSKFLFSGGGGSSVRLGACTGRCRMSVPEEQAGPRRPEIQGECAGNHREEEVW